MLALLYVVDFGVVYLYVVINVYLVSSINPHCRNFIHTALHKVALIIADFYTIFATSIKFLKLIWSI